MRHVFYFKNFRPKSYMNFSSPYVPHAPPISFPLNWPEEHLVRSKITKFFSHKPPTVSCYLLSLRRKCSSQHFSFQQAKRIFQVLQPHTTGKIILCYTLIRIFWKSKREAKKKKQGQYASAPFGAHVYTDWLLQQSLPLTSCLQKHSYLLNYVSSRSTADTDQSSVLTVTHWTWPWASSI